MRLRLFGQYIQTTIIALAVLEFLVVAGVFAAAAYVRFHDDLSFMTQKLGSLQPRMYLFAAAVLVGLLAFGLYSPRQRARASGILIRLISAVMLGAVITAAAFYAYPGLLIGRGVLALASAGAIAALVVMRLGFARVVDEDLFKRRVLIYGAGERAQPLMRLRRRADRRGFVLVGFVAVPGEAVLVPPEQLIDNPHGLQELCKELRVDEIVVALGERRQTLPSRDLVACRFAGIEVSEPPTFLERETGRVCIDDRNPSWMIFSRGFKRNWMRQASVRMLDIVASTFLLALTMPIILLAVVAIKMEGGWRAPVIYRQTRVGYGGREFLLLKFRSMRQDAEKDGKARWAQLNDPRITKVGGIMRRMRIDELPQIVNVLYGDMSFVGPRPERPQFVQELARSIPYYEQRHCVKPGITGWAQLCYPYGASPNDALQKLHYDLYYIKNRNFLFDLSILVQTAEVVLLSKGSR